MHTSTEAIAIHGEKGRRKTVFQTECALPENVEIVIDKDGKRIWVNAEGICLLRVCKAKQITLFDNRTPGLTDEMERLANKELARRIRA